MTITREQVAAIPAGVAPASRIIDGVKVYGQGATAVRALDSISADFAVGKFTAIMGPSGSGKSTLLHCLAGLTASPQVGCWSATSTSARSTTRP